MWMHVLLLPFRPSRTSPCPTVQAGGLGLRPLRIVKGGSAGRERQPRPRRVADTRRLDTVVKSGRALSRERGRPGSGCVRPQVMLLRNRLAGLLDGFVGPEPKDLMGLMEILGDILHRLGAQGVGATSLRMAQHLLQLFDDVRSAAAAQRLA